MVENRYVLYGLLAGIVTGVVAASLAAYLTLSGTLDAVINEIVVASGGSPSVMPKSIMDSIRNLTLVTLVAVIVQYAILGALVALIESYLVGKGVRVLPASLIAGSFFLIINAVVLEVAKYLSPAAINALLKYVPLPLVLAPSITYLIALTFFSNVRGPWSRWGTGEPSTY